MRKKKTYLERGKMKRTIILALLVYLSAASLGSVVITDITVTPQNPTIVDNIFVSVDGGIGYIDDIEMTGHNFQIDGATIYFDIYFLDSSQGGISLPITGDWNVTEPIGLLQANTYSVVSRAWLADIESPVYDLKDSYSTDFTVIPEPMTLSLLALGGLLIRKRH